MYYVFGGATALIAGMLIGWFIQSVRRDHWYDIDFAIALAFLLISMSWALWVIWNLRADVAAYERLLTNFISGVAR